MNLLINETSRLSQLTPAGLEKFTASMAESGIRFYDLQKEIISKIDTMDTGLPTLEGITWYRTTHGLASIMADQYNTTVDIAAGVISALSPRMFWTRNKAMAYFVFANLDSIDGMSALDGAKTFGQGLYSNFAMAIKIARGESIADTLTGTKRRSFYNNIVDPDQGDSVTIDTWMVRAIMNTTELSLTDATKLLRKNATALGGTGVGYYALAESCRTVAKSYHLRPCQVQALYWVAVSGSKDGGFGE